MFGKPAIVAAPSPVVHFERCSAASVTCPPNPVAIIAPIVATASIFAAAFWFTLVRHREQMRSVVTSDAFGGS